MNTKLFPDERRTTIRIDRLKWFEFVQIFCEHHGDFVSDYVSYYGIDVSTNEAIVSNLVLNKKFCDVIHNRLKSSAESAQTYGDIVTVFNFWNDEDAINFKFIYGDCIKT